MNAQAPPRKRRSVAASILGALFGLAAALLIYGEYVLLTTPGATLASVILALQTTPWSRVPFLLIPTTGALFGFLVTGGFAGNKVALEFWRGIILGFQLTLGMLIGVGLGVVAYVLLWMSSNPRAPVTEAIRTPLEGMRDPTGLFQALLIAGGAAGLTVALYMAAGPRVRTWTRGVTGAVIGALAGLTIFTIGYVVVNYPSVPDSSTYLRNIAEAVYSNTPVEYLFLVLGASVGLLMSRYSWKLYGILTLISLVSVVLGYMAYSLTQTLPGVPPANRTLSLFLFVAESLSLLMVLLYSFYSIDVATRKHWRRTPRDSQFSPYFMPKVCLQVPIYNEPPEVVLQTLDSLVSLDYPVDRFLVMVLDDSTRPERAEPIREFCRAHEKDCQILYLHRADRRGYKAGALNDGLEQVPDDVNLIGVIDSDYVVEPEFLRETVGYFVDPGIGWLQTPQDYRNRHESFLTEQYYMADAYFYRAVLPSRNEENSIIFCGTMGLLRKQALLEVGGWGEQYITEDSELSLRLVDAGWNSLYINTTYGRGLIPATFEGYKKQHFRWAFGGGKILRGHFWDFIFGRFTLRQRFDYFVQNINWFEGLFVFLIAVAVLAMGVGEALGAQFVTHHANEVLLIGLVPWFLLIDGLTRIHMVLRRTMNMGVGTTLRVVGMWLSVKFSDMIAACKGFVGFTIPFIRTRKATGDRVRGIAGVKQAVLLTRFESTMATLLLLTAGGIALRIWAFQGSTGGPTVSRLLLFFWLLFYSAVFLAAPLYAYRSYASLAGGQKPTPSPSPVRGVPT